MKNSQRVCWIVGMTVAGLGMSGGAWTQTPPPPPPPPPPPATVQPAQPSAATPAEAEELARDQQLIAAIKSQNEVRKNITHLCDVIGPRLTGSRQLTHANEWAAELLRSYGLSQVKLEPWTIPVGWERGTASLTLLEPNAGRNLTVAAVGWSPGTPGRIEGDVVIFRANNKEELAQYKGKLKNAIVLQGPPATVRPITEPSTTPPGAAPEAGRRETPSRAPAGEAPRASSPGTPNAPPTPSTPPADRMQIFDRQRAFRREVAEFLRTEGAAVLLLDAAKPHGLLNMTGGWRGPERASAPEPLPSLFITHDHYAMLHRLASRPAPARTRAAVDITNTFVPGPVTVYNTVGEIPGTDKADEFVVVGAHIDSWDLGQGATDNGTGTCVVLEAARALAKSGLKPRRTIRFVLFSGEEQGLYGSKAYIEAHKTEMPKTSLAIIHDTGTGRVTAVGTQGREPLQPILQRFMGSLGTLGVKEINQRRMNGSDHNSFDNVGVPGIMFQQDPAEYRLTHHSQSDTVDKVREADVIQGAQVMAVLAWRVANWPDLLPRDRRGKAAAE